MRIAEFSEHGEDGPRDFGKDFTTVGTRHLGREEVQGISTILYGRKCLRQFFLSFFQEQPKRIEEEFSPFFCKTKQQNLVNMRGSGPSLSATATSTPPPPRACSTILQQQRQKQQHYHRRHRHRFEKKAFLSRRRRVKAEAASSSKEDKDKEEEKHMHLLEEKLSQHGAPLQVYYCDEEYEIPSFRDTTILIRSTTPDAVLSEMRGKMDNGVEISTKTVYDEQNATISSSSSSSLKKKSRLPQVTITGGVFDLFALAVALVLDQEEDKEEDVNVNVAILGLGAGTCARLIDDLYHSSNKRVKMFGYELDDAIVDLGMKHFGLNELKEKGSLVDVRVGDALENIKTKKSDADDTVKFDLIIVDLFDDQSRVIPQLMEVERWENISKRLKNPPSSSSSSSNENMSRVICNLSTGRGRGANINNAVHVAELIAETCGNGDVSIWPSSKMNVWNECCISGPKPSFGVDTTPKVLATYCPHWISTSKYVKNKNSSSNETDEDGDDKDDDDDDIPMNGWLLDRLQGR